MFAYWFSFGCLFIWCVVCLGWKLFILIALRGILSNKSVAQSHDCLYHPETKSTAPNNKNHVRLILKMCSARFTGESRVEDSLWGFLAWSMAQPDWCPNSTATGGQGQCFFVIAIFDYDTTRGYPAKRALSAMRKHGRIPSNYCRIWGNDLASSIGNVHHAGPWSPTYADTVHLKENGHATVLRTSWLHNGISYTGIHSIFILNHSPGSCL